MSHLHDSFGALNIQHLHGVKRCVFDAGGVEWKCWELEVVMLGVKVLNAIRVWHFNAGSFRLER